MTTDATPADIDESDLSLPSLDDYIDNRKYATDDDVPGDLAPKRRRRSKKRDRETVETIAETLAMLNGMFAMVVPCSCAATVPIELRELGAHRASCTTTWPLNEDEAQGLSAAIAAEFTAHPEWIEKLDNADTWVAHAMLASVLFGVVMSRRMRGDNLLLPPGVTLPESVNVNGVHA